MEIDADAGSDPGGRLTFEGLVAKIDPAVFVDFETATFTNGAFITDAPAGASLLSAPNGVFIVNCSTLRLGDEDYILGSVLIEAGSSLLAYGYSPGMNTITGDLTLGGTLSLVDDAPDDQTDVTGELDGQGGTIALDVSFGPEGPVASDLVTFGGGLSVEAWVDVNPVPSLVGPTGPDLIQFGGGSDADIDLVGGYLPVDGVVYGLGRDGNSYFLVLDGTVSEEVAGAMALSATLPAVNRDLFGDLGARTGTGDALRRPGLADGGDAIWARMGGTRHDSEVGESGVDVDFDMDHFYAQVGADLFRAGAGAGAVVGAVMAQYGSASADVGQPSLGPSTDVGVDSYGFGLGATWYLGDGETYVDLTGMVNWHDIDVAKESTDAMSYTVGLEGCSRMPMGEGFALAPMGQLVYSRASVDKFTLPSALNGPGKLKLDDPESLEARALAMLELDLGQQGSVQFGGGFAYEFLGDGDVKFGPGYSVETDTSGASGELALRAQFTVAEGGDGVRRLDRAQGPGQRCDRQLRRPDRHQGRLLAPRLRPRPAEPQQPSGAARTSAQPRRFCAGRSQSGSYQPP